MRNLMKKWNQLSLVKQIIVGLIIGIILAVAIPEVAKPVVILGSLFVGALKAIAPVLVLFLVMSAIAQHKSGQQTNMKSIVFLYLLGTFLAGLSTPKLEQIVSYKNSKGKEFNNSVRDILTHVALHGQYHRGQINLLLRANEFEPVNVDFITFVR